MNEIQKWMIKLFGAIILGGILSLLLPDTGTGRTVRFGISLFCLCAVFSPMRQIMCLWNGIPEKSEEAILPFSEELYNDTEDFAYSLAANHINAMILETLEAHKIFPVRSRTEISEKDTGLMITVFLTLNPSHKIMESEIKALVQEKVGADIVIEYSQEVK